MAFIIKDRVKEGTTSTGTGAFTLGGASSTFDPFNSYMSNGDTTYYAVVHTSSGVDEWEVGIGTWNTGNTLSRTTVLAGSNGASAQSFSAGTKDIFMTYPASKAVYTNANGEIDIDGGTIDGTTIGAVTAASGNFTTGDFTGDVDVGGKVHVSEYVDFDAQSSHPSHREGRIWYDNVHKTINYHSEDSNVVHELGVEEHARVYNNSGSTITKGKPVHFSGSRSSGVTHVPTIALANATSESKYKSEGMTASDIPNNSYGYIVIAGLLDGIDTSHLSVGQVFTGITDGATQTMPPVYPNYPMCLGFVVKVDSTEGVIFLAQQNHSIKTFRVQMDQHIGGDLTIDGNLNVTGTTSTTSSSDVTAGAPFYRANEGDAIGEAGTTFTGTGLDDAFFSGHYTGTATITYDVKIDGVGSGTGGVDTFAVSRDGFVTTFSSANDITGNKQLIHSGDNIYVEFGATTGHTLNDNWEGVASPVNVDSGFWTNRNTGTSGVGYTHMGIWYDASSSKWYLTDEYDPVPAGAIDRSHSSYVKATLDANIEGTVTGNVTGDLIGNATSATTLETSRSIGGVSFDGSADINLAGVNTSGNQDTSGNAATATALETSRTIQLSGDVTGNVSFDGSADATITAVVQDDSHNHTISNVDGLQTALDSKTPTARTLTAGNGLTGGGDLTANRTLTVGGGTGVTVNANDIAIGQDVATSANPTFANITSTGNVSVTGTASATNVSLPDDGVLSLGTSDELTLKHHNSGYSHLINTTGTLFVDSDSVTFRDDDGSPSNMVISQTGINVTGNVVVSGTVDGRDVASDGSKLDGIESNAKNDQTITAGAGLSGGGTGNVTLSHSDTSSQGSSNNSGRTYIQDITLDTYGHVTGLSTATETVVDTNTTYSVGDGGLSQKNFTTTLKSKLDGIESGATADQSASQILTAVKTVDGSGSGLDADLLDGQQGSYYYSPANLPAASPTESFKTLSSDPSSPSIGDAYYNTTSDNIRLYMNTGWQSIINLPPIPSANTYTASILNTASSAFSLDLTQFFTDDNTATSDLVYAMSGNTPNGMSVSGTNLVHDGGSWSGTSGQVTYNFNVTATDSGGAISAGKPFSITLDPEPTPQLNYIPSWNSPDITQTTSGTINVPQNIPPYTVCWVQLVGSGGGSNTTDYSPSWGFGGYGGSARLIICRADDLNGSALTVPAGGAPNPGWQGGQAHATTINIKGTIYTTSHSNQNQVIVHPAVYDVSNLTTPHFTFSAQSNSNTPSPNMGSVNSMTFGSGTDNGGSHTNSASGGNKIWAGGNGYGDYGGTGYQTSSYAGNGGTARGANNAQELGGGGASINLSGAKGGVKIFFS